jgi:hypothetical protein
MSTPHDDVLASLNDAEDEVHALAWRLLEAEQRVAELRRALATAGVSL